MWCRIGYCFVLFMSEYTNEIRTVKISSCTKNDTRTIFTVPYGTRNRVYTHVYKTASLKTGQIRCQQCQRLSSAIVG